MTSARFTCGLRESVRRSRQWASPDVEGQTLAAWEENVTEHRISQDETNGSSEQGGEAAGSHTIQVSTRGQHDQEDRENVQRARPFSFAQMLVEAGVLSSEQVDNAQEAAHRERLPLEQILVRDGLIVSRDLATLTALHLGLPMVDLRNEAVEPDAVVLLPQEIATRYLVLPIRINDDILTVAMTDPTDLQAVQDLTSRTGRKIEPVIATPEDIQENIELSYRAVEREAAQSMAGASQGEGRVASDSLRNAQPTEIVEVFLRQALQDRASDIHIEPTETRLRIRYRIDGVLHGTCRCSDGVSSRRVVDGQVGPSRVLICLLKNVCQLVSSNVFHDGLALCH